MMRRRRQIYFSDDVWLGLASMKERTGISTSLQLENAARRWLERARRGDYGGLC